MKISIVCLTVNFAATCVLLKPFARRRARHRQHVHLVPHMGLLLFALRKKSANSTGIVAQNLSPLALMTIFAGLVAWESWRLWESSMGHGNMALKIGAVFVPAGISGLAYWLAALAFKIPAAKEMAEFAFQKFRKNTRP